MKDHRGPLVGLSVIEIAAIGPVPFAGMVLSDLGADVIRIDRVVDGALKTVISSNTTARGRRSIGIDLKSKEGAATALRLIDRADVVLEGFRPGVMERLGIGPDQCRDRNPRLIFGRMTGWGQDGPLAMAAGHDINYIAVSGLLHGIGRAGSPPTPPLNLVGDYGGGAMMLVIGVLGALFERERSGLGQVIDAAMVDGAALLSAPLHSAIAAGTWDPNVRGTNALDSGCYYYDVYETADGKYISIGALESQFYEEFVERAGLTGDPDLGVQRTREDWPRLKERMADVVRGKTRDDWCELLEGSDACFAPVLSPDEATRHPHIQHRATFVESSGVTQPAPAPRFSRTPGGIVGPPPLPGQNTKEVLESMGFSASEISALASEGTIA